MLGLDNLAIRKKLQRWFESGEGLGSATFRQIMLMGYGQPKHAMESGDKTRPPVIFLGSMPWDPKNPINRTLDERSARLNEAKDQQLALEAADRKAAEVIDVTATSGEPQADEGESLEIVRPLPPPDPSAYR